MQVEELAALAKEKIAVTKREHRLASTRANIANQYTKDVAERVLAQKTEHLLDRTEVVLQLKSDVNSVQAEVLTKASKHRKKVQDGSYIYLFSFYFNLILYALIFAFAPSAQ